MQHRQSSHLRFQSRPLLTVSTATASRYSMFVFRRFLEADLAAVNRSHTPWLIVGGHRPFYIDSTNAAPGWGDLTVADDLQDALEDLFLRYQVRMYS